MTDDPKRLALGVGVLLACATAGAITWKYYHRAAPPTVQVTARDHGDDVPAAVVAGGTRETTDLLPVTPSDVEPAAVPTPAPAPAPAAPPAELARRAESAPAAAPAPRQQGANPRNGGAPAEAPPGVPLARVALGLVGVDAEAEQVWMAAINDPSIPAKHREDLIEDLNEEGFPDPKHITLDDVPLILSRIDMIERIGGDAMDETNAAAFAEAYKDLHQMLEKLARQ